MRNVNMFVSGGAEFATLDVHLWLLPRGSEAPSCHLSDFLTYCWNIPSISAKLVAAVTSFGELAY